MIAAIGSTFGSLLAFVVGAVAGWLYGLLDACSIASAAASSGWPRQTVLRRAARESADVIVIVCGVGRGIR
jgi:hypothetical protein